MGFDERQSDDSSDINRSFFFKPHEGAVRYAEYYQKKFLCVDKDHLEIYGDFNSEKAN